MCHRDLLLTFLLLIELFVIPTVHTEVVEYDLTIAQQTIDIAGGDVNAITINGGIPGPVLRFREGDLAVIRVHNEMDVETSIHWHGVLVPPGMDGVPFVSYPPIAPGSTFIYKFPIRQHGTYWYHSHTMLQEQIGLYGAIVIESQKGVDTHSDKDYPVVLSDWTDIDPHSVLRILKTGSEWFSLEKGSAQSLVGAIKSGKLGDFVKRELQRMPPMDIADVSYDRFLANGSPELFLQAKPGETVRLRMIAGSSTTFFYLQFAGGPLTVIAADGQDVVPFTTERLLIAVAETYDVLVTLPDSGMYEFRATSQDGSAFASIWIGSGKYTLAPTVPRPDVYRSMGRLNFGRIIALTPTGAMGMSDRDVKSGKFDQPGMLGMGGGSMPDSMEQMQGMSGMGSDISDSMEQVPGMSPARDDSASIGSKSQPNEGADESMAAMPGMSHDTLTVPAPPSDTKTLLKSTETGSSSIDPRLRNGKRFGKRFLPMATDASSAQNAVVDGMDPERPWPPYAQLRALKPTAFDPSLPVRSIRLTLDGDMQRYVWFINNKPLSESDSIVVHKGEVVRFIMINRTMMHHPMHLHGHFFRVLNGQGDYAPLKHTVDVVPMSTTVIEFDANEFGEWFFHCHLLYHMESGMARTVHYAGYVLPPAVQSVRSALYRDAWYAWTDAEALSNMTSGALVYANTRNILVGEWEVGWHRTPVTEWEGILTWRRYVNRFFTMFVGGDFYGAKDAETKNYAIAGFYYVLPLNIDSRFWLTHDATARLAFGKELVLLPRLAMDGDCEYDTNTKWQGAVGTNYMVSRWLTLSGRWHSDYGWGGGFVLHL